MRINIAGSPVDRQRVKKFYTRGLSWHPSGPFTPGDTLKTSRADTPTPASAHGNPSLPLLRSLPHAPAGGGHGGTRNSSTSRRVQTWSVSPAAMAGVLGCHRLAEPLPFVGSGCGRGWRRLA